MHGAEFFAKDLEDVVVKGIDVERYTDYFNTFHT